MDEAEQVLTFWFGSLADGFADDAHRGLWFGGGTKFDQACEKACASLAVRAADGDLDHWQDAPRSCLAFIILCDQIPRNIHRGRPLAFATDGSVGYIIGAYATKKDEPDVGKFTLTLRRNDDGRWLIVSDMDNGNESP